MNHSLQCEYLGWGELSQFRSSPSANETAIFSPIADSAPPLIRGFLDCLRTSEVRTKIPSEFSENDAVEVMVAMVRQLPETLFQTWKFQSNSDAVVCAVLRWSAS